LRILRSTSNTSVLTSPGAGTIESKRRAVAGDDVAEFHPPEPIAARRDRLSWRSVAFDVDQVAAGIDEKKPHGA